MNVLRAVPVLLLLASSAQAEEECQFDAKALKPQFASTLPRGFKLVSTKKEKRQIVQVLKLNEGSEATVTLGGCEHVNFTIALKTTGLTSKTVGAELVAIARRVLPLLPMDKDATVDVKLMIHAIDEARINIMPAQLPCGDATCQLSLEAEEVKTVKGKKPPKKVEPAPEPVGVLKLSYDFPL